MTSMQSETLLTPAEVARRLGVSPITVRSWVQKGWIKSQQTPGGHSRFYWRDVETLMKTRGIQNGSDQKRILIVDDEEPFRQYLQHALRLITNQYHVDFASDGFEAGLMLADTMPDIVLVDYAMPGMSGDAVCRIIKNTPKFASIYVVALTGMATESVRKTMLAAGADAVMFKPVDMRQLKDLLENLEGKESLSCAS